MTTAFICPRCKRELGIQNPRSPHALDEEYRRTFPRHAANGEPTEEVCHECYQKIITTLPSDVLERRASEPERLQ